MPHAPMHRHGPDPRAGRQGDLGRPERRSGLEELLARNEVGSSPADMGAKMREVLGK